MDEDRRLQIETLVDTSSEGGRNPWDVARDIAQTMTADELRAYTARALALAHFDRVPAYPSVGLEPKVRMDAARVGDRVRLHGVVREIFEIPQLPEHAGPGHNVTLRVALPGGTAQQTFSYPRYVHIPLVARPLAT